MLAKLLGSLAIAIYAGVVPVLELNATHLFNPEWPPHARTHEAWQLITNSAMGGFALWVLWRRSDVRLAGTLSIIVMGSFLAAHALQPFYGGSMALSATLPARTLFGLDLGVAGAWLAVVLAAASLGLARRAHDDAVG